METRVLLRPPAYLYFLFVLRASAPPRPVFFPYLQWAEELGQSQKEMSHTGLKLKFQPFGGVVLP